MTGKCMGSFYIIGYMIVKKGQETFWLVEIFEEHDKQKKRGE